METIPEEIQSDPRILAYSKRVWKDPRWILLDKSYHYGVMGHLSCKEKRGRPDIVHLTLLEALGSPLNLEGLLQTYIHTINDYVISVSQQTRIPRNYNRFLGLMEQFFQTGRIPPEGEMLMKLQRAPVRRLIKTVGASYVVAFSRTGRPTTASEAAKLLAAQKNPAVLIGGFPKGKFTAETLGVANDCLCIDPSPLDAWVVVSRVLAAYEEAIGLPEKRLGRIKR